MTAIADERIPKPATAWHCCLEFFSVSTRLPAELRLTTKDATRLLLEEVLPRFSVHQLPAGALADFLAVAGAEGTAGGRIYDAHIAEVARLAGSSTVVTDNVRDFTVLARHGIIVLRTREFVAAAGL